MPSKLIAGTICILGKPNVGKSTLFNTIFKNELMVTSPKPQTTRSSVLHNYSDGNSNLSFIDMPGFHKPINKLDELLNVSIKKNLNSADLVLLLIDPTRDLDDEDIEIINIIKKFKLENVYLVLTKQDIASEKRKENIMKELNNHIKFLKVISISSLKNLNVSYLISEIKNYISTKQEKERKNDGVFTTLHDDYEISELIRKQIIFLTNKEIPYAVGIYIENKNYSTEKNMFEIFATICVEKESQKPIIIGKGGNMLKRIREATTKDLLKRFDCKINLHLFVKVEKDWRNNENKIKKFIA